MAYSNLVPRAFSPGFKAKEKRPGDEVGPTPQNARNDHIKNSGQGHTYPPPPPPPQPGPNLPRQQPGHFPQLCHYIEFVLNTA